MEQGMAGRESAQARRNKYFFGLGTIGRDMFYSMVSMFLLTYITEVQHMEGDVITTQDLFRFEQTGMDADGKLTGHFVSTGMQPSFMEKFQTNGVELPEDFFMPDEEAGGRYY